MQPLFPKTISAATLGFCLFAAAGYANAADAIIAEPPLDPPPARNIGPVFEVNAWGGYLWRNGDGLNATGAPFTEIEDFPLFGGGALLALPFHENWLIQFEFAGENAFDNDDVGGVPANDTYDSGYTGGGHLAYMHNNFLFGVFGGGGQTNATAAQPDQDATHWLAGGEARYMNQNAALGLQVGYLDASSDNLETISDTTFARVFGTGYFNSGQTSLSGSIAYADGTQDADAIGPDPTDLWIWDVTLEHQLAMLSTGNNAASVFVSYQGVYVNENRSVGGTQSITDQGIYAGLTFRFGANQSLYDRDMYTAPNLPNVHRWLGAVPAVD